MRVFCRVQIDAFYQFTTLLPQKAWAGVLGESGCMMTYLSDNELIDFMGLRRDVALVPAIAVAPDVHSQDAFQAFDTTPLAVENIRPGADLMLGGFAVQAGDGGTLAISGTVLNVGDRLSGISEVFIYVSQDRTLSADDLALGSFDVAAIDSGNLFDFSVSVVLPPPVDPDQSVFIGLRVDATNAVAEADETNNDGPTQEIAFSTEITIETALNTEPYVLVAPDSLNIQTTQDLAGIRSGEWRLGETLSATDLAALRSDLAMARVSNFDDLSISDTQVISRLQSGAIDLAVAYRGGAVVSALPSGFSAFEIPFEQGDLLGFDPDINLITGTSGDNRLVATQARDLIAGGGGRDTAFFAGAQASHTLTLTPTSLTVWDRNDDSGRVDTLISIETLDFGTEIPLFAGSTMPLDIFAGPTALSETEFGQIIELYIAYFNRAPDAIGLYYWGTEFERGFTIRQTAASMSEQPETRATYASVLDRNGNVTDPDAFVTAVYENVLGRAPDAPGFAYWINELENNPNITPPIFILAIINGAKFPSDPTPQTALDQQYLATKADIGAYYSVIKGLSDVSAAREVMALFDGTQISVDAAIDRTDAIFDAASDPVTGDFLFPLVGVIDDPFAIV
jgi:hypothetical protein